MGFTVFLLVGTTLISVLFGGRMLALTLRSGNTSVEHLEKQVQQLKSDKESLEARLTTVVPVPTVSSSTWITAPFLPKTTTFFTPPSESPITSSPPKFTWVGKTLKVDFNLQYVANEGGPQQGRIIILARGPSAIFAHPSDALNLPGLDTFITPTKGEYFSVSRFREVNVEFPVNKADNLVSTLEVIILNTDGKVLIYQTYPITVDVVKPTLPVKQVVPAKPHKTEKPATSEIIEPGVDQ